MIHKRRRIRAIVGLAACGIVLAACGSSGSGSSTNASGVTTLSFWARSDDSAFISTMVKAFNQTHSKVKLSLTVVPTNKIGRAHV